MRFWKYLLHSQAVLKNKKEERKEKLRERRRKATRETAEKAAQKEAQDDATKATKAAAKAANKQKKRAAVTRTEEVEAALDEKLEKLKATNKEILEMQKNHSEAQCKLSLTKRRLDIMTTEEERRKQHVTEEERHRASVAEATAQQLTQTILQAVPISDAVRRVQDVSQSMKATLIEATPKAVNLWSCAHKHGPWSFDPSRQGNVSCLYPKCELLCQLVGTKELEAETDSDDTKPLAADFTKPVANKYSPKQSNKPKPYEALMALPALPAEQAAGLASNTPLPAPPMKQAGVPAPDTPGPAPPQRLSPPPSMKQAGTPAPGTPATILSQGPLPPIIEEEAGAAAEGSDTEPSEESETASVDWSEDADAGKDEAAWPDEDIDEE